MRPARRGGEICAGNRVDLAAAADEYTDRQRKIIPADGPLIAIVVDAGRPIGAGDDMKNSSSQISSISWRADLVIDHADRWSFPHQPHHGLDEIVAKLRIHPGSANDQRAVRVLPKRLLLAIQLGSAISIDRRSSVVFPQRSGRAAIAG